MPKAVLIMGFLGSGKTTQAMMLVKEHGFINFDTGANYRKLIEEGRLSEKDTKDYILGTLLDPRLTLRLVKEAVAEIRNAGDSIVLAGSPRTPIEAFGHEETSGLIEFLKELYGKDNLHIFRLEVPESEAKRRSDNRSRGDMLDDVWQERADQFKKLTLPVLERLDKEEGVIKIDGTQSPEEVFAEIQKHL